MKSDFHDRRIGIFGGTFDPPHIAHLIIAEQAVQQLKLDKLIFVPAYIPPHKTKGATASPSQRYAMIKESISGRREFDVTSIEMDRKGISYTIDTIRDVRSKYKNAKLFLIVGGDNYRQFEKWKSAVEIRKLVTLVVFDRSESHLSKGKTKQRGAVKLKGTKLDISSTLIRHQLGRGESIHFLVLPSVERFIRRRRLYV
jgi:nicotinate-nucleotide adenylyltransferase